MCKCTYTFNQRVLINKNTNFSHPLYMVNLQRDVKYEVFYDLGLMLNIYIEKIGMVNKSIIQGFGKNIKIILQVRG